ncbi:hypothetical protein P9112_001926 [Eukaryota sp. TZLM1-RC]
MTLGPFRSSDAVKIKSQRRSAFSKYYPPSPESTSNNDPPPPTISVMKPIPLRNNPITLFSGPYTPVIPTFDSVTHFTSGTSYKVSTPVIHAYPNLSESPPRDSSPVFPQYSVKQEPDVEYTASPKPSNPTPRPSRKRKSKTNTIYRKKANHWSPGEDDVLVSCMDSISDDSWKGWKGVAELVGNGKTPDQCSQRWHRVLKPGIKKGHWAADEDQSLANAVANFGTKNWKQVATLINGRTDIQCRYRWHRICNKYRV